MAQLHELGQCPEAIYLSFLPSTPPLDTSMLNSCWLPASARISFLDVRPGQSHSDPRIRRTMAMILCDILTL